MPNCITRIVADARELGDAPLDAKGETDDELAASLVAEMIRTGLRRGSDDG